jgi:hypothetical protein
MVERGQEGKLVDVFHAIEILDINNVDVKSQSIRSDK